MNGTVTATRLWTALLVLVGVLVMHGAQCAGASAGPGHHASAGPGHHASAGPGHPVDLAPAAHSPASVAVADSPPIAPHGTGGHLWTVCLAVLATAVAVLLAVLQPRPLLLGRRTLPHVRARLRRLSLARSPDLSALCLLRI